MWFCDPPIVGFRLPENVNMRLNGQRVDEILVYGWRPNGENPALEFAGAILVGMPTVRAKNV
jgi:hypothetical protein